MGRLYDETSHVVYSVALRLLRNPSDAEEVTLDVYTQVWREAGKYSQDRGSAFGWLMNIARSRAIDHIRARRTRTDRTEPIEDNREMRDLGADPEQLTELSEKRNAIRKAMEGLPQDQRQVIRLAFFLGLTHTEVAGVLGAPLGTVKTRIRTAMIRLRELLGEQA